MGYTIIPRSKWGARYDNGFGVRALPIPEKWLHHSVTIAPDLHFLDIDGDGVDEDEERAMRVLEDIGEDRFNGGISYTFCVMPSGRIYEGHSIDRVGAHTAGRNTISASICLVGNYQQTDPTEMQKKSVAWLLEHGRASGWWYNNQLTGGHRDVYNTGCPGDEAYDEIAGINTIAATGGYNEEDDMFNEQDRLLIQSLAARVEALSKGYGTAQNGPDAGEEIWQSQHLYEVQHTLRRLAALTAEVGGGPAWEVPEGEVIPLVALLTDLKADVESIKEKLGLS